MFFIVHAAFAIQYSSDDDDDDSSHLPRDIQ